MSADSNKISVTEFIFLCVCGFMVLSAIHIRVGIDRIRKQQIEMNQKLTNLIQMVQPKEVRSLPSPSILKGETDGSK